jgi:hypothetical protein
VRGPSRPRVRPGEQVTVHRADASDPAGRLPRAVVEAGDPAVGTGRQQLVADGDCDRRPEPRRLEGPIVSDEYVLVRGDEQPAVGARDVASDALVGEAEPADLGVRGVEGGHADAGGDVPPRRLPAGLVHALLRQGDVVVRHTPALARPARKRTG